MNFLAHALLAGEEPAWRLGGLLGDFVKGPLAACALPADIVAGVALHRAIDDYAERHASYRRSRARVSPARRRYAGILVDLFYDHLLAASWLEHHAVPLADYAQAQYALLAEHSALWPPASHAAFARMRSEDWLYAYRERDAVARAVDRIARHRLRHPNPVAGAIDELATDPSGFADDCATFLRDAGAFAYAFRSAAGAR